MDFKSIYPSERGPCKKVPFKKKKNEEIGTSLVVQWLRLCVPNAGGPGLMPGQGTRYHMPQLKDPACRSEDPAQPNKK